MAGNHICGVFYRGKIVCPVPALQQSQVGQEHTLLRRTQIHAGQATQTGFQSLSQWFPNLSGQLSAFPGRQRRRYS